jgi:hypothetical protein
LAEQFAQQPEAMADFVEERYFPFRKDPVILMGEVRVSRTRGLSLHYVSPDVRTVIIDREGMLVRQSSGQTTPPDPRANLANNAMLNILRFDFAALDQEFEMYGKRADTEWALALVPRAEALRRAIGNIHVSGSGTAVRKIALRRSARQHIDIVMSSPRAPALAPEDQKAYFR